MCGRNVWNGIVASHLGSVIFQSAFIRYVVVGMLAFVLGILITQLCLYWKKVRTKEREKE